ncbi:hypothetical protein MEX01_52420 [Methylorubrum extorquens]|nr:hypothetical protein MEX01_52420 [Methylorubrum extorquens]
MPTADLVDGFGEHVKTVAQHKQQHGSLGSEPNPAHFPVEEAKPQCLFEEPDLMANGGRRDAQLVGGTAKTQAAPSRLEGPQRRKWGKRPSQRHG